MITRGKHESESEWAARISSDYTAKRDADKAERFAASARALQTETTADSDSQYGGTLVRMSGIPLQPTETLMMKSVWIQLAKSGSFTKDGHPFTLDAGVFSEIIRNFQSTSNRRIPVDFEHASEMPSASGSIPFAGAPAQGWITELRQESGNLWGEVEWGAIAEEYIKNGNYKFISPAIRFGCKDPQTGKPIGAKLSSAGLVNIPFLDGMQPLTAKSQP
jgi:hypothetical protein